jgi:hypothetical protein
MSDSGSDTAVMLTGQLPTDPPGDWQRTDPGGGIVEYRLPDEARLCTAAKLTVRPDLFGVAAVRLDRTQGCQEAGTTRYDDVSGAVAAVRKTLETAPTGD